MKRPKNRQKRLRRKAKERANWDEFPLMPKEVIEKWKASNKNQSTLNFDLDSEEDQTQEVTRLQKEVKRLQKEIKLRDERIIEFKEADEQHLEL